MAMRWHCPPENSCGKRWATAAEQADPLQQDRHPAGGRSVIELGPGPETDGVGDLAPDAAPGVERGVGVLEDHLQGAELGGPGGPADHLHRLPAVADLAGARGDEADGRPSEGRLPATRFAHQADDLPGVDGQRRADDGPHRPAAPPVVGDVEVARARAGGSSCAGAVIAPAPAGRRRLPAPPAGRRRTPVAGRRRGCAAWGRWCGSALRAHSQRGWNAQPPGMASRLGGDPGSAPWPRPLADAPRQRPHEPLGIGVAGRRRARPGSRRTRPPGRRTGCRSGRRCSDSTPRSWVMIMTDTPRSRRSRSRRRRIPACTVTSRAVVGSSATSRRGSQASAMAMAMRWRMPPENWCGWA